MAKDERLRVTPWQAVKMLLLMPPMALFLLAKTCLMWLLLRRWRPPAASPTDDPDRWDIVCLSHVNWHHIWQRNHHMMVHLSRQSKILYVNTIRLDTYTKHTPFHILRFRRVRENLYHHEVFVLPFERILPLFRRLNQFLVETRIRYQLKRLGAGPVVLWFYFPSQRWLAGTLNERAVVYDIQDEYAQFRWAPFDTAEKEKQLLAQADVVFAGTDALFERKRPLVKKGNIHFFPCGVDFDHFNRWAYRREWPRDLHKLHGKVTLGYFGLIDERIDRDLLLYIARERPDWNLVLIGPVNHSVFKMFDAPNVVFTHAKSYEALPFYLACFDICLMPFAINELTLHINPTKALESFASGKPLVSTPIPDMVKYYSDVIYFAATPQEFVAQCEAALANFPPERRERALQIARDRSWQSTVASMRQLINDAIAARSNPKGNRPL